MKIRQIISKIKKILFVAFVITFVTAVFLVLTNSYFFKVRDIRINENGKYTYDDVLEASGISIGEELYGIDVKKAENKIKEELTYTKSVAIRQIPPSTLSIEIETDEGFFGIMIAGDYYIISDSFKVLDKTKNPVHGGVITVRTNEIKKCYLGEKIEFSDGDVSGFLKEIVELFKKDESGRLSAIKSIDITNKFKVAMNYGDRFLVKFGIFENIAPKITNVFEIMDERGDDDEGIIDATDGKTISFKYVENIFGLN